MSTVRPPDAGLVRDVLLRDGLVLRLRAPTPDDFEEIKAFYDGLSDESRYLRFHGYGRSDLAARAHAEADGVDRVSLIGRQGGGIVAAAGYEPLREPGTAEVAFAVADDFQGRGTATRMLEQLAAIAAQRGICRFNAEVMSGNRAMLAVFARAGFEVQREGAFGEITVTLDITPTEAVQARFDERHHLAALASLEPIFAPSSVAIVRGADAPDDLTDAVVANIVERGFTGGLTVVGQDKHQSLLELEHPPELVVVIAAGDQLARIVSEAATIGSKAVVALTATGAGDPDAAGPAGEQVLEFARGGGLRLVGPGSLGVVNTDPEVRLYATFAQVSAGQGGLAICSQSEAIGIGLLGQASARGLGISSFVSLGDRLDVSTNDLLELWEEDERSKAVMLYVETFGNPARFGRIAQRVSRRKPILAVKGRRAADAARLEARSHTAAALRGDAVVDALFQRAGVLRFRSGEELLSAAEFLENQPLPEGRRVGIISNSSGVATLSADACATRGLVVPERPDRALNPVIVGIRSGPDEYRAALSELLSDRRIDAVLVHYVDLLGGHPEAVLEVVSHVAAGQAKPVAASIVGADGDVPQAAPLGIPNFRFPEACAAVLARAAERREWLSRPLGQRPSLTDADGAAARRLVSACLEERESAWLTVSRAEQLLATHGLPLAGSFECGAIADAVAAAREIEGPIALKANLVPPALASDIDAVLLGLDGDAAVRAGWREVERRVRTARREWHGALVQPLAPAGADVLVGTVSDPDLGPVIAVGVGGRQAGLASSVAYAVLPSTDVEADELIDSSTGVVDQLEGYRGGNRLDRVDLRDLILRFAALLRETPEVMEADLNPVRVMTAGCLVLDIRIRIEPIVRPTHIKTW